MLSPLTHDDPVAIAAYRLIARLGSGGMGTVYLARSADGRTVALKTMHAGITSDPASRNPFPPGDGRGPRDVRRLAPAADAWLKRGIAPEAVHRTLTAALPTGPIHHPVALLAHRLTVLLPPPLPASLKNCDCCDRAFRAREPGLCRDCR